MTRPAGASGDGDVPVRDAATVVLLRDGPSGPEAWLLTRVVGMVFAAGASVFPGGRVEASDAELPMSGDVLTTAARFGCDETTARTLLGAAVRETFEETGVLLTVPPADTSADPSASVADVEAGRLAFGDLLRDQGLAVDAAALHPWSRWVTPPGEPRRYDTRFFVAALPSGAVARDLTSESSRAEWVPVAEAIEQGQRGERGFLPPTVLTLVALADSASVAEVLHRAGTNDLAPTRPVLRGGGSGVLSAELPDGRLVPLQPAPMQPGPTQPAPTRSEPT